MGRLTNQEVTEARALAERINALVTRSWKIMEVCGGQTHSIAEYGVESLISPQIELIHGPGCPVCVTPISLIDKALELAGDPRIIFCTYGDMLRVPGTREDLLSVKARGGDVRFLYSPLAAVNLAKENPDKEVVFFAVGFETTAPASAMSVLAAKREGVTNFSLLVAHVQVPPSLVLLMESEDVQPQAFLAPGHVCAVTGVSVYAELARRYQVPIAVTGFSVTDILKGILCCVRQLEHGESFLENPYARVVRPEGNPVASGFMREVFEPVDRNWRGLGRIADGGMALREEYAAFDALRKWAPGWLEKPDPQTECRAGEVLRGLIKPSVCPAFGKGCTPMTPLGAPMVSGEGACSAYYRYKNTGVAPRSQS